MSGKRLGEDRWAEIQHCYEETAEPVPQMAFRFDVAPSLIYRRASSKGWKKQPPRFPACAPPRPLPAPRRAFAPVAASDGGAGGGGDADGTAAESGALSLPPPPPRPLGPPLTTETRLRRLLAVIDRQLEDLEHHMTSGEIPTPQEEERLVRAAGTTIGNIERVMEMTADLEKDTGGKAGPGKPDAARMRREIAERLERLNAQWQAHGKPR